MAVMDGYVRVSRRARRDGDSYHSPEIQREEIERWARNNGVELGTVKKEENVSGAKAVADRGLERLLERVEAGVSDGIIVYKTDRFARDAIETLVAAKRIKEANGRLVGVSDGVDSDQANGKMMLGLMATMAEQYLDGVKAGWSASTSRAVANGVHIAARAPVGYLRADQVNPRYDAKGKLIKDGRLMLDSEAAPVVLRAYEMWAKDSTLGQISDMMREGLERGIAKSTVGSLLRNRAYLGEARGPGGAVKPGAHDPIVSEKLFSQAQARRGESHKRNGKLAGKVLLGGLVTCASCGHKLRTIGSTNRSTGERLPTYSCAAHFASGDCQAPAAIKAALLDAHVVNLLRDNDESVASAAVSAEQRYLAAREAAREAEAALDAWVNDPAIAMSIGAERFRRGLLVRQEAFEGARRELWDLDDAGISEDAPVVWIDGKPHVYEVWGKDMEADRRHIRRYVRGVVVGKADPKRRRWQPIEERVEIAWVGQEAALTRPPS
ncbi:MAG TPA: recombinase family protein [Solirubrobacterales bacterium]|jgi:DNA invertase Pin-like site-specific DNA recombinase|nr:recombinase family protein [Solirubrobacterales bacterium]